MTHREKTTLTLTGNASKVSNVTGRTASKTSRQQVIETLLERYHDLVDPMQSRGVLGDGEHLPLMPATYTASVRELERLLGAMREDRLSSLVALTTGERASVRSLHWHVSERYIRSLVRTRDVPVTRRAKGKRTVTVLERRVVTTYSPKVRQVLVDAAIAWLADNWALRSEPMLPNELLAA